jgi:hypothetical protein
MLALVGAGQYIGSLEGGGVKNVTTAGTQVQLSATEAPVQGVIIQSYEDNTGNIAVGGSDVTEAKATRVGVILQPGGEITLAVRDLNVVWIDSAVNGEGVSYLPIKA